METIITILMILVLFAFGYSVQSVYNYYKENKHTLKQKKRLFEFKYYQEIAYVEFVIIMILTFLLIDYVRN